MMKEASCQKEDIYSLWVAKQKIDLSGVEKLELATS